MADDDTKSQAGSYPRRARYLPGLLMVSPVWIVVVTAGWDDARLVTVLLGAAGTIGLPFLLESFVRDEGKKVEVDRLPGSRGLLTTTLMLWPEPATSPEAARNAVNRGVVERALGITLPSTPPSDDASTAQVKAELDEAVAQLRVVTRDASTYSLLAQDNAEYGMWRNLLGVRKWGIGVAVAAVVGAAVLVALSVSDTVTSSTAELVAGLLLVVVIGAFWWAIPSERRVTHAAHRYALALFDAARLRASAG